MDGFAAAQKGQQVGSSSRQTSEETSLERLRRCASYASLGSFDGSEGDGCGSEDWGFVPSARARLVENKNGGLWAVTRRSADGTVFFGTQAGEVRALAAPGSEGALSPEARVLASDGNVVEQKSSSLRSLRSLLRAARLRMPLLVVWLDACDMGPAKRGTACQPQPLILKLPREPRCLNDWSRLISLLVVVWLKHSRVSRRQLSQKRSHGCPALAGTAGVLLGQHADGVYALALSGDGKSLFSASQENIRLWNVAGEASGLNAAQFTELTGHSESAQPIAPVRSNAKHLHGFPASPLDVPTPLLQTPAAQYASPPHPSCASHGDQSARASDAETERLCPPVSSPQACTLLP